MKVIEENSCGGTEHQLETLVMIRCRAIVTSSGCQPSGKPSLLLSHKCLASLAAWHTASCCVTLNGRQPQWQWARSFLVDVLCHYPGAAHEALLTSLFLGRFIFLRVVSYRTSTGLERVLLWIANHGPWVGRRAVRKELIACLKARFNCESPPEEPLLLVQSIINDLLHKINKKTNISLDTAEMNAAAVLALKVLSCWMGSNWLLKELLPFLVMLLATKNALPNARLSTLLTQIAGWMF